MTHRLGVDIGGTFTDLVLVAGSSGATWVGKTLTTPDDPAEGVRQGIEQVLAKAGAAIGDVEILIHGTTLVANAVIERKGARTAFVTTRGFRDVLLFRREFRYDIYDLGLRFPPPLVPRRDAFEVDERVAADGSVLRPLEDAEAERVAALVAERGHGAVAVCLLHSFANPSHERRLRDALARRAPETCVSLSSEVLPQIREYERACATTMNAFVQPVVQAYLERLDGVLRAMGFGGRWYVMASSGKILSIETAGRYPVQILESGPAAGALAAAEIGARMGLPDLLSFDMGGTTAKASLVTRGRPSVTTDFEVARVHRFKRGSGLPVKLPVIDMIEIGAGGGSIAQVNALGLIEVGPESAGAKPGPACYARGGDEPTVTDANLVLGYLDPDYFLGGEMRLDRGAAERALERLGRRLGLDARRAALGIHRIVTANMAEAIRTHAAEKGIDDRRLPLVAFGGAGPVHAFGIARALGIGRVVFPPAAGALSAWGFLAAPLGFDFVRSHVGVLAELDPAAVREVFDDLERQAQAVFREAGVPWSEVRLDHAADLRYRGQGFEVTVPLPATWRAARDLTTVTPAFEQEYERLYGRLVPGVPVEVVSWRLGASGPKPPMPFERRAKGDAAPERKGRRTVLVDEEVVECAVYERDRLRAGSHLTGPALVEERECTLFVGPDSVAIVDEFGAVVMELEGA